MENEKSIYQLIKEQEQTGKKFLVPSYQRGYRWQQAPQTSKNGVFFVFKMVCAPMWHIFCIFVIS